MLDIEQCEFLLSTSVINQISIFLNMKGLTHIRITKPEINADKGKILLLVSNQQALDDYSIGKILYELRKLPELGKNPCRKSLVFLIEEDLQPFFKRRMVENALPFSENTIQTIANALKEKCRLDAQVDESNADCMNMRIK